MQTGACSVRCCPHQAVSGRHYSCLNLVSRPLEVIHAGAKVLLFAVAVCAAGVA